MPVKAKYATSHKQIWLHLYTNLFLNLWVLFFCQRSMTNSLLTFSIDTKETVHRLMRRDKATGKTSSLLYHHAEIEKNCHSN